MVRKSGMGHEDQGRERRRNEVGTWWLREGHRTRAITNDVSVWTGPFCHIHTKLAISRWLRECPKPSLIFSFHRKSGIEAAGNIWERNTFKEQRLPGGGAHTAKAHRPVSSGVRTPLDGKDKLKGRIVSQTLSG